MRQRKLFAGLVIAFVLTNSQVSAAHAADLFTATEQMAVVQAKTAQITETLPVRVPAEIPEEMIKPIRMLRTTVTAYSSQPNQTDASPFVTASGSCARDGVIAANSLRIGTKVRLPDLFGAKVFVVEDRMNARYANRVDVWMADDALARQFGLKRNIKIEVVGEGDGKKVWHEGWTNQECAELNA